MRSRRDCPNCHNYTFPLWVKVFATWPFVARCRNCDTKVRLNVPRWQNITFQILAQIAFWSLSITAIVAGSGHFIAAVVAAGIVALLIALAPGIFAGLEESR